MKKIAFLLALCVCILVYPFNAFAEDDGSSNESNTTIIEGEIVVRTNVFYDPADFSGVGPFAFNGISITSIEPLFPAATEEDVNNWLDKVGNSFSYLITLASPWTNETAIATLEGSSNVLNAVSNCSFTIEIEPIDSVVPEDVYQWAHEYIGVLDAWDYSFVGSDSVRVAVLDTGFVQHSDLQTNVNWSEAYDIRENDTDVTTTHYHGNFVAGIIGADYSEEDGFNGVCQSVDILPIKIYDGECETNDIENAIYWAIAKNAKIINLSFSLPLDEYTENIISAVENAGVLLVTSAGNNGKNIASDENNSGKVNNSQNWIVVGSLTSGETKAVTSNYSSVYVDLFAPGANIYSTGLSGYKVASGTSFAAPHVAAACALIMSHATHLTPLQVKQLIMDNVKEIDGFNQYCVSGGSLSLVNALDALYAENRGAYSKGDINGDGYITTADRNLLRSIIMGTAIPTEQQLEAADVNLDGEVDQYDYTLISRYCAKTFYFAP